LSCTEIILRAGCGFDQKVEAAEKTLREKTLKGTLTEREKQHVIRGACTTVNTMKALNSAGSYIKNSFDYALKGDYSKNFNVLGMILNVGIGLIPVVGQAADVRDLSYALTHTKENSTWGNIALIGLALIAFIPLFGDVAKNLKYAKYLGTAGDALKQLDNIGDVARGVSNSTDELADAARKAESKIDEIAEGGTGVVKTPYGDAVQSLGEEAKTVKASIENGGTVYRGGTLGRSNAAEGQFWAPENPLNPGYADRYGVDFSKTDFIIGGKVKPNSNIITRPAPELGSNGGGAIEIVTAPNNVKLDFFYMP
jgi:hypothetical protein